MIATATGCPVSSGRVSFARPKSRILKSGAGHPFAEVLTLQELRDDVRRAVVLAEVVDRENARVIQGRGGARLLLEAAQPVRIIGEGPRQDLHRDVPLQPNVAGPVDLSHAARADRRDDLVRSEPGTGGKAHFSRARGGWYRRKSPGGRLRHRARTSGLQQTS